MSFIEVLTPPALNPTLDPVAIQQDKAMLDYYQRLWTPEVLRFDFTVSANGYIGQARFPLRKSNLRWLRVWTAGAVLPGSFDLDIYYDDGGVLRSVFAVVGDRFSAVAGVTLFAEKAPTRANLPTFSTDLGNAKFFPFIANYVAGPWPGVTLELVFVPA